MHETTQVTYGEGTITVIMSSDSTSEVAAPDIRFLDYNEAAQRCFTEKELSQIYAGDPAKVNLEFIMSDELSDSFEHEQFFSNIPTTQKGQEPYHEGVYISIDGTKEVGEEKPQAFDSFSEEVEMQLDIPLYLVAENRSYYILANRMGAFELLEDTDEDDDTFTIMNRNLGTTLLLYRDNAQNKNVSGQTFRISSRHLAIACIIFLVLIWVIIDRLHRKDRH